ncbi:hypothetical protein CRUP_021872 [Coryphaenoides rupestris]|nr:hypothetical protein CRUP_021872 [Coryphaenoides rupestris]
MIRLGLASKNPCVILQDVLQTEPGRAFLGRNGFRPPLQNGTWAHNTTNGQRQGVPSPLRRGQRSDPREEEEEEGRRRPVDSQCHQRSLSVTWKTSQASPLVPELHNTPRRPQQTTPQRREGTGLNEPLIRTDGSYSEPRAQVSVRVPLCGGGGRLPVSPWLVRRRGLPALSPGTARGGWTEPGWASRQITLKKRWNAPVGRSNGAQQIKDPRQSILRSAGKWEPLQKRLFLSTGSRITLSQLERRAHGPGPVRVSVGELASVEVCISPSVSPSGAGKSSPEPPGLSQDHSSGTDESEAGESSPRRRLAALHLKVGVVAAACQQKAPNKDTVAQEDATEPQEYSCMTLPFYALQSGCYKGHANGNIMELRRYSLWERNELQARGLHVYEDQQRPPMFLLLLVSYTQAVAAQTLLLKLSGQQRSHALGQVSPFLLLSLKTRLEGVEAAVLRSALEIAALDNLAWLETADRPLDMLSELDDIETPDLSLDASLELIRRTGLDPQLLSLLGIKDDGPYPDSEADPDPPVVVSPLIPEPVGLLDLHIKVCNPATGLLSELSADPVVVDPEVPPAPAETTETEEEKPSPVTELAAPIPPAGPVYSLRHRRAGASYTVSLAKPDGTWTRFKHQGVARRQVAPDPHRGEPGGPSSLTQEGWRGRRRSFESDPGGPEVPRKALLV